MMVRIIILTEKIVGRKISLKDVYLVGVFCSGISTECVKR